ncbi:MAG: type 2 lanthipeptide synthetase LanM, partial [Bacilli bacterium]|nr:type 2 lanthipeptide synthetase LanM [Bacilli bacterium]
IEEKITACVNFYKNIIGQFFEDEEEIEERLCLMQKGLHIVHIESSHSDVHHGGQQVARVELSNGLSILYKPHSMLNEKKFTELLHWISAGIKIRQLDYDFLSYETHSWCTVVQYKCCHSKNEIREYYRRLGVQLFLAYFLGTHDLHYENVIASGEYPVIIDLETLTNVSRYEEQKTLDVSVRNKLSYSVLSTGLLPVYFWNTEGIGIDSSGISGGNENCYPFKIPIVVESGTSNMYIDYSYPKAKKKENRAMLGNVFCLPAEFETEFIEGFSLAYRYVLSNVDIFRKKIRELVTVKSRYLVANTQRYAMILSSSYHPSLLKDGAERELFLRSVCKGKTENETEIMEDEVKSLLQGDIPYYMYWLNSKNLYSDAGMEIKGFFQKLPIDVLMQRVETLNEDDMESQIRYIKVALELTLANRKQYENKIYSTESNKKNNKDDGNNTIVQLDLKIDQWIEQLINMLIKEAVWNENETEVTWCQVKIFSKEKMTWSINGMNMYLYDGLAGMLLIFYELNIKRQDKKIEKIYETLKQMLFSYTDKCVECFDYIQSKMSGAFEGEGSIVYAYLLLYQESKNTRFLEYAEKHSNILKQLIEKDSSYDMISGNAGAAYVLIKLYEYTKKNQYLQLAERAVIELNVHSEKQKNGIGWRIKEYVTPMSGMAHGNAGILIPVFALWKKTGKEIYRTMAEEIWKYEEFLYDEHIQNWRDVRKAENNMDHIGSVAWCHGVGGILLSRMYCYELADDMIWKQRLQKDIIRAREKLRKYWRRDSWTLCHGICGNMWILEETSQEKKLAIKCINQIKNIKLLPQELMNPGLMDGYGGIIYYFIKNDIYG